MASTVGSVQRAAVVCLAGVLAECAAGVAGAVPPPLVVVPPPLDVMAPPPECPVLPPGGGVDGPGAAVLVLQAVALRARAARAAAAPAARRQREEKTDVAFIEPSQVFVLFRLRAAPAPPAAGAPRTTTLPLGRHTSGTLAVALRRGPLLNSLAGSGVLATRGRW
jgi:hypothetical protein